MAEDVRGLFKVMPAFLRVEDVSKRLPQRQGKLTPEKKKKKAKKGASPAPSPKKGRFVDVVV
ncbi:MAG TPA: hypothetical protein ENJ96_04150 [Thermodesulfatator atlanticus]|uniref:Uncharacterized protein n=1 Tax=Thermodesulfatator atlanticus TaxID=501497 RepID=A0A7V5NZD6_9BACT|nr:hypothetical protein [Thermodesulfatator atlanticus]